MASSLFQASLIFFPICLLAGLGGYFADQWLGPNVPLWVFIGVCGWSLGPYGAVSVSAALFILL